MVFGRFWLRGGQYIEVRAEDFRVIGEGGGYFVSVVNPILGSGIVEREMVLKHVSAYDLQTKENKEKRN